MGRRFWWLLTVPACASPPPAPPQEPQVVVVPEAPAAAPTVAEPEPSPEAEAAAPAVDSDLPPAVERPPATACKLSVAETDRWMNLRIRPGRAPVLQVRRGVAATVQLPLGQSLRGAFVEAKGASGTVFGWLNGADLRLFPARSIVFGGYAIPHDNTLLHWKRSHGAGPKGRIEVEFEPDRKLKPKDKLRAEVDCASLALRPVAALDVKADLSSPQYWGELASGSIPLAVTPGGSPVATLEIGQKGPRYVSVHASRGAQLQAVFYGYQQLAFGWIDATSVTKLPSKPDVGYGHGRGWGLGHGSGGGHWRAYRCSGDTPIIIDHRDQQTTVGHLDANALFEVSLGLGTAVPEYLTMRLRDDAWLHSYRGARLTVRSKDLASCAEP